MLMGQKYRVRRSVVLEAVRERCGVDLTVPGTELEIAKAIQTLDEIKANGLTGDPRSASG